MPVLGSHIEKHVKEQRRQSSTIVHVVLIQEHTCNFHRRGRESSLHFACMMTMNVFVVLHGQILVDCLPTLQLKRSKSTSYMYVAMSSGNFKYFLDIMASEVLLFILRSAHL